MAEEGETPEWEDVIRAALESRLLDVHTAIPARAEADREGGVVPVKPLVRRVLEDERGKLVEESLPVLPSVPVASFRAGGMFVSLPVKKGDHGLLVFSEAAIDRYRATGQEGSPGDVRRHGLSGAVFWPGGIVPTEDTPTDEHADNLVIGLDEDNAQIHITPSGSVIVGQDVPKKAARKGDPVKVTIPSSTFLIAATGGVLNPAPVVVDGEIDDGSDTVSIGD